MSYLCMVPKCFCPCLARDQGPAELPGTHFIVVGCIVCQHLHYPTYLVGP